MVARETIISSADASLEVFGVLLGEDSFSVSIDMLLVGDAVIPIHLRDSPIVMKDVRGQHVPWPKQFVLVQERKVTFVNFLCYFLLFVVFCPCTISLTFLLSNSHKFHQVVRVRCLTQN